MADGVRDRFLQSVRAVKELEEQVMKSSPATLNLVVCVSSSETQSEVVVPAEVIMTCWHTADISVWRCRALMKDYANLCTHKISNHQRHLVSAISVYFFFLHGKVQGGHFVLDYADIMAEAHYFAGRRLECSPDQETTHQIVS